MTNEIELRVDRAANGGASVGRDGEGRTVFCDGALPGELVRVSLTEQKKRFARGLVTDVLDPASGRIEPTCPTRRDGCGGCDMAHASIGLQRDIKAHVVRDALVRIGRFDEDQVDAAWIGFTDTPRTPEQAGWYRTTARLAVSKGGLGYRKSRSNTVVRPTQCGVIHPLLENVVVEGRFPSNSGPEVVLRVSDATGEVIVIVDGERNGVVVPGEVEVVSRAELAQGREVSLNETAAGRSWVISAGSFFQAGPAVATQLVEAVRASAGDVSGAHLVDAYAGVGLFAGTIGTSAASVTAIESSTSSVNDARENLAVLDIDDALVTVVPSTVESWQATPADIVIADPARAGLGADGVRALVRCNAGRFVLVSCDTGSFGRDAGLLRDAGYQLDSLRLVDAFRDTSHVETVAAFTR